MLAGVIDHLVWQGYQPLPAWVISRTGAVLQAISLHLGKECFISTIKRSLTTRSVLIVQ